MTSWYVLDDKLVADRAILSEIEAEESGSEDSDGDEDSGDASDDVVSVFDFPAYPRVFQVSIVYFKGELFQILLHEKLTFSFKVNLSNYFNFWNIEIF